MGELMAQAWSYAVVKELDLPPEPQIRIKNDEVPRWP
jgi:hypothetical protein